MVDLCAASSFAQRVLVGSNAAVSRCRCGTRRLPMKAQKKNALWFLTIEVCRHSIYYRLLGYRHVCRLAPAANITEEPMFGCSTMESRTLFLVSMPRRLNVPLTNTWPSCRSQK